MAKLRLLPLSLLAVFAFGQQNATTAASNVTAEAAPPTTSPTSSLSDDSMMVDDAYFNRTMILAPIPPWGESSFGGHGKSKYRLAGLLDIRRAGWSWTPSYLRKSAPFCYDTGPRPLLINSSSTSACYNGDVASMCKALGGTSSYQDTICIEDPATPFAVVGPVCWNQTCYNEATFETCEALGGQFVGEPYSYKGQGQIIVEDFGLQIEPAHAAWCAVPGRKSIVGPACYGEVCFTAELAQGCAALGGTSFADIFCLLDDSYTVIGPICKPTHNKTKDASVCFPEETAKLCLDMGGTNIGDIFCVIRGSNYSVLGPFCDDVSFSDDMEDVFAQCEDTSDVCREIGGTPLGDGSFCVLKGGDYVAVGPSCTSGFGCPCASDSCESLGGTMMTPYMCVLKGAYSVVGPVAWDGTALIGNSLAEGVSESIIVNSNGLSSMRIVLNGSFSVYGPSCYGSYCYSEGDCLEAGGSSFGGIFCAVSMAEGQSTSEGQSTRGLFMTTTTALLCMLVSVTVMWG
jgi:hypothetical protein